MKNITFLGPIGATFSHDAYNILAHIYGAPKVDQTNYIPAASNGEILKLILQHGGYGAIAMETLAEGRVAEPLESFIELLTAYTKTEDCPFRVIGAIRLKLHFCLMVRQHISQPMITKIIAHPKALGACKERIMKMTSQTLNAQSNGEAARLVAENAEYADCAALGPKSAAEKYGLKVLSEAFEDREAITTFFLIGPTSHQVSTGKENRILIVFKVPHMPGALVKSLQPFEQEGLNLIQIHSVHAGNHTYNFAIEIESKENESEALNRALETFGNYVDTYLSFGPFEVLSR
jgi:prephenate dehydratase